MICRSWLASEEGITDSNKTQSYRWCKLWGSSDSTHLRALCRCFSNVPCCPNCAVFR
ncbi:hypothetical protein EMIT0196MI5_190003 [Pseudomonas sp. IT-196MI5]